MLPEKPKTKEYYDIWELISYIKENSDISPKDVDKAFDQWARDYESHNNSILNLCIKEDITVAEEEEERDTVWYKIVKFLDEYKFGSEIRINYWW